MAQSAWVVGVVNCNEVDDFDGVMAQMAHVPAVFAMAQTAQIYMCGAPELFRPQPGPLPGSGPGRLCPGEGVGYVMAQMARVCICSGRVAGNG